MHIIINYFLNFINSLCASKYLIDLWGDTNEKIK